ncbi:uncharacterized protein [Arachis hypogaea]|uniref:uncharacterized protein n=1 Tax=Arachis hypogaea TaxID=3818 RepID=UPI003B21301F
MSRSHFPELGFLCETKNQACNVEQKLKATGFSNWFIVDPDGVAGGMVLAWREGVTVQVVQSDQFFIAERITDQGLNERWGLIGVHLNTNEQVRSLQFSQLQLVIQQFGGKVVVTGDFNAITSQAEKLGGIAKSASSIAAFRNFIDDGTLVDIGMVGRPFTWTNRRRGDDLVQERLDRVLVGTDWLSLYANSVVLRLSELGSDHAPLLIDSNPRPGNSKQ